MNINQVTEKAIADHIGALTLDNTKMRTLISIYNTQVEALKARVIELESHIKQNEGAPEDAGKNS